MYTPGMKVLVIGGEGFVGSHLVDAIPSARALDDRSFAKHRFENTIVKDIREPLDDVIRSFDIVVHAACRDIRRSMIEPIEDAQVNIVGTLNILATCRRHKVPLFFISSVSVEREVSHYAVSKSAGERYAKMYRQWVPTSVVRLSNVFGVRDSESVVARWLKDPEITLIDENATRDFTYVEDTIAGITKALTAWPQEIVNIGTGVETRLGELADWIAKRRGIPVKRIPPREIDNVVRRVVNPADAEKAIGYKAKWKLFDALEKCLA